MKVNLRSVDLNLLTVFDAIMRSGKLSGAADKLGMTQPAVSNALARLRLTFDDELFLRTRYGVTPTPRAEELLGPIRDALSLIESTLDGGLRFDPDKSSRTFRLAIGDYGEVVLLPALLQRLSGFRGDLKIKSYPELDETSYDLLKQGQMDLYFDYKPPRDEQLKYCELGEDEVVVIARQDHPRFQKKTLTKKEYLEAEHIILNYRHRGLSMLENILHHDSAIGRKAVAEVNQYIAVPGLVASSDCIATVPRRMANHFATREAIRILPLPFRMKRSTTYMIWHSGLEKDRAHQWLKQLVLELSGAGD